MLIYVHIHLYIVKVSEKDKSAYIYQTPPHRQAIIDNTSTDGRQDKLTPWEGNKVIGW